MKGDLESKGELELDFVANYWSLHCKFGILGPENPVQGSCYRRIFISNIIFGFWFHLLYSFITSVPEVLKYYSPNAKISSSNLF